jgi:hypothetical protein
MQTHSSLSAESETGKRWDDCHVISLAYLLGKNWSLRWISCHGHAFDSPILNRIGYRQFNKWHILSHL